MATLRCLLPGSPCFDPADPISNVSSEAEDAQDFLSRSRGSFGLVYGRPFIDPEGGTFPPSRAEFDVPGTPGYNLPPLGSSWSSESCGGFCTSLISQDDADLCAVNLGTDCLADDPPETIATEGPTDCVLLDGQLICFPAPDGTQSFTQQPRTIYGNEVQSCSMSCPDGTSFTYTLPAGVVKATTQAEANSIGHSLACARASANRLCLSDLSKQTACVNGTFSAVIVASSGTLFPFQKNLPITFLIVSGSLPPGLVASQNTFQYFLDGSVAAAGTYTFTLRASDSLGNIMTKVYTIKVIGIATASIPSGTSGDPYSTTLAADGPTTGALTWTVVA